MRIHAEERAVQLVKSCHANGGGGAGAWGGVGDVGGGVWTVVGGVLLWEGGAYRPQSNRHPAES